MLSKYGVSGAACDAARCIHASYIAFRRASGGAESGDFPITRAACTNFVASMCARSKSNNKASIRKRVLRALTAARDRFALPLATDVDLSALRVRAQRMRYVKLTIDLPLRLVVFAEEAATHGVGVQGHYDRSFVFLCAIGARLGNFQGLTDLKIETISEEKCVTGRMDLKDGSTGCWCGFPVSGLGGDMGAWVQEHVDAVNEKGVFPAIARGGRSFGPEGMAELSTVRARLSKLAVRAGYAPDIAKKIIKGHGPRHIGPAFGSRLMWSQPARAEFGMWAEGDVEAVWDPAAKCMNLQKREKQELSSARYAKPAKQQVQMRLFAEMRRAIRSLVDCGSYQSMPMVNNELIPDANYVNSEWYNGKCRAQGQNPGERRLLGDVRHRRRSRACAAPFERRSCLGSNRISKLTKKRNRTLLFLSAKSRGNGITLHLYN